MSHILLHGDPILHRASRPVARTDLELVREVDQMHRELADFRRRNGFGRAIAAPQIGIAKRIIAMDLGAGPITIVNPVITWRSESTIQIWDDCMSVPDRIVRVRRHRSISLEYEDEQRRPRQWERLPSHLSELVQHEIDHLDGIVMVDRAVDDTAIRPRGQRAELVESARPTHRLSLEAIAAAARVIDPVFLHSPQYECEPLSAELGCSLTLKVETTNPIGSFKGRGADYLLRAAPAHDRPIVCASAGNFGQAIAYAARARNRHVIIYASELAHPLKVQRMRALGADVRLRGADFDAAKAEAKGFAADHDVWMVEDGREAEISEGAGSIAVELLGHHAAYDAMVVPLGNGALLGGMARWVKAASPGTRMLGVGSRGADAMERSWRTGRIVERSTVATIADGLAVRAPIPEAVGDLVGQVDDVLLVDDSDLIRAMRLLFWHAGLLVEPAGAAGVAAILAAPDSFAGQNVATVLCGCAVTQGDFNRWVLSGPASG